MTTDFPVGVNYWPADLAMTWWTDVRAEQVDEDFGRIAAAGLDSVRFFLRWEDFQPVPGTVDDGALANLRLVADLAAAHSLRIIPTLFCGHMSGANWLPDWMLAPAPAAGRFPLISGGRAVPLVLSRDWWADVEVRTSQQLWAFEAAAALAGHPALWAWDLGNENSNIWLPRSRDDGRRWLDAMAGAIRTADPGAQVTIGTHMEDLEQDRHLGPREAAEVCDFLCMHGYPPYCQWVADPYDPWLCPFLSLVTGWLGGKDVLFAEYGAPASGREEVAAAHYSAAVATNLRRVGATGALLWCYADYVPTLWGQPPLDRAPHERHFGLWRAEGSPKPVVSALERVVPDLPTIPADLTSTNWADLTAAEYWADPRAHLPRLYDRFRDSIGL